jgi:hypothetical protein
MRAFLLWLDDERTPHRSRMFLTVATLGLIGVGALAGLAVGAPGKGAVVGACAASVAAMVVGIAACATGVRAKHDSPNHLMHAFRPARARNASSTAHARQR